MEPNDFSETNRNELLPTWGETGSLSAAHNQSLLRSPPLESTQFSALRRLLRDKEK